MSILVLLRHGESQWNLENRFTGWVDVPLTERGRAEARKAGERLRETSIRFSRCFTSKLVRAQETLQIVLGRIDLPIEEDAALNERHYGMQGLNKAETAAKFGEQQVHIWRRSFDVPPPNGESLKDTAARTLPYFSAKVRPALERGENVLVAAHGNSLRSIVMDLEKLDEQQVLDLNLATGIPIVYDLGPALEIRSKTILDEP